MAKNEAEFLFDFKFGDIVAKLHLGAQMAVKGKLTTDDKLFNTGILNNDINAKPENKGNVEFNVENKDGVYEIGIVRAISYKPIIYEKSDKKLQDLMKKQKQSKITDKPNDAIQKRKDEIVKENKKREENLKKEVTTHKNNSFQVIKQYMTIFAGKEVSSAITESSLVQHLVDDKIGSSDNPKFDDFRIPPQYLTMLQKIKSDLMDNNNEYLSKISGGGSTLTTPDILFKAPYKDPEQTRTMYVAIKVAYSIDYRGVKEA